MTYERIMRAAENSRPSDAQLAEWTKRTDDDAERGWLKTPYSGQVSKLRSALTGWDGNTIDIDNIEYANSYVEPGYSDPDKAILFGNWNHVSKRVGNLLEQAGYEMEWEDEWATCDVCNRAVRTSADSYGWQPSYVLENDCEIVCHECLADDPTNYLESLEDNPKQALNIRQIDPAQHDYIKLDGEYENGWHPGQNDDPKKIFESLTVEGHKRILFQVESVGQFDMRFVAWEHKSAHKHEWTESMGRINLTLTLEQAQSIAHQGQCAEDVYALMKVPEIASQLATLAADVLRACLKEYGAWDADELADHETNLSRILWLAGNDIKEEDATQTR